MWNLVEILRLFKGIKDWLIVYLLLEFFGLLKFNLISEIALINVLSFSKDFSSIWNLMLN